jgi:hypothetical protein
MSVNSGIIPIISGNMHVNSGVIPNQFWYHARSYLFILV